MLRPTCIWPTSFCEKVRQRISAAASDMGDELATLARKIDKAEEKVENLEQRINTIRTGDDAAVEALGYCSRDEAKADLAALTAEKAQKNDQLKILYETRLALTQQQQQSGAGTSMLLCVRQT